MDPPDDDEPDSAERRRAAFRAAQRSTSNVFLFRRLKWAALPTQFGRAVARSPILSVTGLLVLVIVASVIGYLAVSVWPAILAALS